MELALSWSLAHFSYTSETLRESSRKETTCGRVGTGFAGSMGPSCGNPLPLQLIAESGLPEYCGGEVPTEPGPEEVVGWPSGAWLSRVPSTQDSNPVRAGNQSSQLAH